MKLTKIASKGFSLVEMLVVIIGVIAAIAVPQIADFTDAAETAKSKRNAQNLSSVASAAQAAGLDFTVDGDGVALSVADTVEAIVGGAPVDGGSFDGKFFGVPSMGEAEQTAAAAYLEVADGVLKYNPAGN